MSGARLTNVAWLEQPQIRTIFSVLDGVRGRTRAVGGVVRDTLMGRPYAGGDIDLASELVPDEVMARAKASAIAAYPTGLAHGTVTLRLEGVTVEVTTLRRDVETDGRHARVLFGADWRADAERRDFTLNALYCHANGEIFDPLDGLADARAGRVRFIGAADRRIAEDGLRVYRFFRLSASHGREKFDAQGLAACRAARDRLGHVSAERVGGEMTRLLSLPKIAQTVTVMTEIGLVQADASIVQALRRYEILGGQNALTRLALLAGGAIESLQKAWRLSNAVSGAVARIERAARHIEAGELGWAVYRHPDYAMEGLALSAARQDWPRDRLAETAEKLARELGRLSLASFPVSGTDLKAHGFKAGPELGKTLARLEKLWVESRFSLTRAQLLERIESF